MLSGTRVMHPDVRPVLVPSATTRPSHAHRPGLRAGRVRLRLPARPVIGRRVILASGGTHLRSGKMMTGSGSTFLLQFLSIEFRLTKS